MGLNFSVLVINIAKKMECLHFANINAYIEKKNCAILLKIFPV